MNIDCPHCGRSFVETDAPVGRVLKCPECGQSFFVPPTQPASTVPSRPRAPRATTATRAKTGGGLGWGKLVLLLLILAIGGFGYAMFKFGETPARTWARLGALAKETLHRRDTASTPAPTPVPTPTPEAVAEETPVPPEAPTPAPPRRPDPLAWLGAHKDRWPHEVVLRAPMLFPIIYDGREAGTGNVPAGSTVTLRAVDVAANRLTAAYPPYGGSTRSVPIDQTDLPARAARVLAQAEREAGTPPPGNPATQDPTREASREEISAAFGAIYTREATIFRVFAPNARAVSVVLYDEAEGPKGRVEGRLRARDNFWELTAPGDRRGKFYCYRFEGPDYDPKREVLDPYATNAVASSTRGRISELPAPPRPGPRVESPTDMVIYEMHVRDFTVSPGSGVKRAGLYPGFVEADTHLSDDQKTRTALDHLTELGVTHVQLLPVFDFDNDERAGQYNWGYAPVNFFSPEGMYATNPDDDSRVREFRALVDALHARGIGVILDVVYNHTGGILPLQAVAPKYYYRYRPNGTMANGSACGNEFCSEAPMARKLILDSLKWWVREYGVDGFRFDLMALLDRETMRRAEHELRAINPSIVLYGEPWKAGSSPLREGTDKTALRQVPVGAFNDDFRNALHGLPDGSEPGFIQNGSNRAALKTALLVNAWCGSPGQSINYMTCHDNLVLWDKLQVSMPDADEHTRIETMKLGYLALLTAQGVPFMQGGEEFGRTKGGNNNSYDSPDTVNAVDWSLKAAHPDLFNYVKAAVALRKAHPVFRLRTRQQVEARLQFKDTPNERVLMYGLNGAGVPGETWSRVCVVLNSGDKAAELTLPGGAWSVALNESGAAGEPVQGRVSVPGKAGWVLYQRQVSP